jgi:hypothetical protein
MTKSRLASIPLLTLILCWLCIPARAEGVVRRNLEMHLLRPGLGAIADIDGDQIPDFASGIKTGRTSQGYSYRVDLDLSNNPGARPFSLVSPEPTGLNIEAIDVDGDHDIDLVISGRLSRTPIGVWLNDGKGGFTRGEANDPIHVWNTAASVHSPSLAAIDGQQNESRRPPMKLRRKSAGFHTAYSVLSDFASSNFQLSSNFFGPDRLRAPPISNQ